MHAKLLIKAGISVLITALIINHIPVGALRSAFRGLSVGWLIAALACVAAMMTARWCRWHRLVAAGGVNMKGHDSARSLFAGFTLSLATPGRLGELARCLFVDGSSRGPVLLLNILDRALDVWALVTYAVLSLMAFQPRPYGIFALGVWLAILPPVVGMSALVSDLGKLRCWPAQLREGIAEAGPRVQTIRIPSFAAWALISTGLDLLTFHCLVRALHPVEITATLLAFPWIIAAAGLPISIAGFGPREGTAVVLLGRFAVPSAVALDAALLLWLCSAVLPAVVGAVWLAVTWSRAPRPNWRENLKTLRGEA